MPTTSLTKLPTSDEELLQQGEWVKALVLHAGASPETAYKCALAWVEGLRRLMDERAELAAIRDLYWEL